MRHSAAFLIPLVTSLLVWTCTKPEDPVSPSFATGTCTVGWTYIGTKTLTVPANSINNFAGWFISNTGTTAFTVSGDTPTMSGTGVTAVRKSPWATFPFTLSPGERVDADIKFDVAASGTGSVGITISTSCGSKTSPIHPVIVQAGATGIPYGVYNLFTNSTATETIGTQSFTLSTDGITAPYIIARINAARSKKLKLLMAMTGGAHENYMSTINGVFQFDMAKWKAAMDTYKTQAIKDSVAKAVADGVIIGNSVMDEPHVHGVGDGNTWGPPGTMTKARVDTMCAYVKAIFPTLPAGVAHQHGVFEPDSSYKVCDFIIDQYSHRSGDVAQFRDAGLALGQRDGHAVAFSLNILNGGVQDRDGTWDCTGTGGLGLQQPNCRMTAAQVRDWGQLLGVAGCAMTMWRYDSDFMARADNQQAFADVASLLATKPSKACRRV